MPQRDQPRPDINKTIGSRPAVAVAFECLRARLDAIGPRLDAAVERGDPRDIHRLRVATRRADAALGVFARFMPKGRRRKLQRSLRAIRRAAAVAREADVHAKVIDSSAWPEPVAAYARRSLEEEREQSVADIAKLRRSGRRRRLERQIRRVLEAVRRQTSKRTFAKHAAAAEARLIKRAERAARRDLSVIENLHALRLRLKRVRYGLETLAPAHDASHLDRRLARLTSLQDRLGRINDAEELASRCRLLAEEAPPSIAQTLYEHANRYAREASSNHARFVESWPGSISALDEETPEEDSDRHPDRSSRYHEGTRGRDEEQPTDERGATETGSHRGRRVEHDPTARRGGRA